MFRTIAFSLLALVTIGTAATAQANITGASSQLHSTLVGHGGQVAYIWSVELYASCPTHGDSLYGRYFVTCDYYGNYLDYGGINYAINDIIASGRGYYVANPIYWRETTSW